MKIKNPRVANSKQALILAALLLSGAAALSAQTLQYDFKDWVAAHLDYPQAAYERMYEASVPVNFKVAADGTITGVECRADLSGESDMIRLMVDAAVASAPKWLPASGVAATEDYSLMVDFEMPKFGKDIGRAPGFVRPEWVSEEDHRSHDKLRDWIASQIEVPEGFDILMTGIVEKGGTLGHTGVVSTSDETVAAKVLEVVERAPKWTPGLDGDGEPVRAFKYIYMRFGGEDDAPERETEISADEEGIMPTFRGGDVNSFRDWVMGQLIYPFQVVTQGVRGMVLLRLVVDKDGSVTDVKTLHSPNETLTRMAVTTIERSPKWTPGLDADGNPVSVYYTMPVIFDFPKRQ